MHPVSTETRDPAAERLFTVDEYYAMARAGILSPDERVELLDGKIVPMAPIGSRHAACVDALAQALHSQRPGDVVIRVQGPVRLSDRSEPEPDIALLRGGRSYIDSHPGPQDVLLVIEVADSSVRRDREQKAQEYARAGVEELWIVDLNRRVLAVHRQPEAGGYRAVRELAEGVVSPALVPDIAVDVNAIEW